MKFRRSADMTAHPYLCRSFTLSSLINQCLLISLLRATSPLLFPCCIGLCERNPAKLQNLGLLVRPPLGVKESIFRAYR